MFGAETALLARVVATGVQVGAGAAFFEAASDSQVLAALVEHAKKLKIQPVYTAQEVAALCGKAEESRSIAAEPDPNCSAQAGWITFYDPGWSVLTMEKVFAACGLNVKMPGYLRDDPAVSRSDEPRCRRLTSSFAEVASSPKMDDIDARLRKDRKCVPTVRVLMMATGIHYLATRIIVYPDHCVFCRDVTEKRGKRQFLFRAHARTLIAEDDESGGSRKWVLEEVQ